MEKNNDGDELVVFDRYENAVDANIVKGVLETNGVPCMLTNQAFSSLYPVGAAAPFAMVGLMVHKRDLKLAHEIMESKPLDFEDDKSEE